MNDNSYTSRFFSQLKLTPEDLQELPNALRREMQQHRAKNGVVTVEYPGQTDPKFLVELSGQTFDVRYIMSFNEHRPLDETQNETGRRKHLLHPITKTTLNPVETERALGVWNHCFPFSQLPFTVLSKNEQPSETPASFSHSLESLLTDCVLVMWRCEDSDNDSIDNEYRRTPTPGI